MTTGNNACFVISTFMSSQKQFYLHPSDPPQPPSPQQLADADHRAYVYVHTTADGFSRSP